MYNINVIEWMSRGLFAIAQNNNRFILEVYVC